MVVFILRILAQQRSQSSRRLIGNACLIACGAISRTERAPLKSIFVRGYLTTPGQSPDEARRMIEDMGFEFEAGAQIEGV